jgi:antitoxin CptB
MNNDKDILKKKLIYRSQYRGTKEMDKIMGSFVKNHIEELDKDELNELEKFINIDDDTLYKIYNKQQTNIKIKDNKIVNLFKDFIYKK